MQTLFSDMNPLPPSNGTPTAAKSCESEPPMDGFPVCTCTRETFGCSIHPNTRDEWIASMRASLARILAQQGKESESTAQEADSGVKSCAQSTLFDLASYSWRTVHAFGPKGETVSLPNLWRVDTPGAMEYLPHLMLVLIMNETDGGVWLPTLTVCGNYNRKGASATSGDGLITRLKRLPTLCARDARSVAGSQPPKRSPTSGLPLTWSLGKELDSLAQRGLRLNHRWSAWFMGWPMGWFLPLLGLSETDKSRSKQRSLGDSSEAHEHRP